MIIRQCTRRVPQALAAHVPGTKRALPTAVLASGHVTRLCAGGLHTRAGPVGGSDSHAHFQQAHAFAWIASASACACACAASVWKEEAKCDALGFHGGSYDDDGEYFDAHYDSKNLLGSGTFGIVLCCVHKRDGSLSAVKMVQDLTESEAEVQREIEALRLIKQEGGHENIVRYNGAYRHNGFHYIVTEFVDGETLYSMLQQRQRPFDEATSLQMVVQLGSALSFLKQTEIIHRDLKPDNIMVLRDGDSDNVNLKIIDFGSAGTSGEQNREMSLSGTRCYLSPEVLLNGEVSHAMDVWSLGCILYILLSGRHPFDLTGVSTEEQIVARISSEAVSFDLPVWQHVSSDVKKLIVRLLEKNPRERLTVDELLAHPAILQAQAATP